MNRTVCAVVVTYQPDMASLLGTLSALGKQVGGVIVVDNASTELDASAMLRAYPALRLERMGSNEGIGAAQNRGIDIARAMKFDYVLLLDQDSYPEDGMVAHLLAALRRLNEQGIKVACVGPRTRIGESNELSTFGSPWLWGMRRGVCHDAETLIKCDVLIASGSLIPMAVLKAIGGMEEELFIDQVDTEWCLRANSRGYAVYGVCGAVLGHRLGEETRRVWIGRWRRLPRHKPFRYYYIFRNTLRVSVRPYVSLSWRLFNFQWLATLFLLYGVLSSSKSGELRMMLRGTMDALRGVTGKLDLQ